MKREQVFTKPRDSADREQPKHQGVAAADGLVGATAPTLVVQRGGIGSRSGNARTSLPQTPAARRSRSRVTATVTSAASSAAASSAASSAAASSAAASAAVPSSAASAAASAAVPSSA